MRLWKCVEKSKSPDAAAVSDASHTVPAVEKGQHSIRINEQWRICFVWREGHAHDVEIVDYH